MSEWRKLETLSAMKYICSFCDQNVGSDKGYGNNNSSLRIYLCPLCDHPTYFEGNTQIPSPAFGQAIQHLPADIEALYNEARKCTSAGAFTATVLACRKLLMHIAVEKGAEENKSFAYYVGYLAKKHCVPPGSEIWVERIRAKGNEANHEIVLMSQQDAEDLINFLEMLLKFMYEFPGKLDPPGRAEAN